MFGKRPASDPNVHRHTVRQPGVSLAKGPALVIGLLATAAGLLGLLRDASFPAIAGFPDADPVGTSHWGIEINGWTSWITILAGALLLFGAAQHHLAKAMSAIVGVAMLVAAVLGFVTGDVLGLAAANWVTSAIWAVGGVLLLLNVLSPRRERTRELEFREPAPVTTGRDADADATPAEPVEAPRTLADVPARDERAPDGDPAHREAGDTRVVPVSSSDAPPAADDAGAPRDAGTDAPPPTDEGPVQIRSAADRERLLRDDPPASS